MNPLLLHNYTRLSLTHVSPIYNNTTVFILGPLVGPRPSFYGVFCTSTSLCSLIVVVNERYRHYSTLPVILSLFSYHHYHYHTT